MVQIAPSMLSADFLHLQKAVEMVNEYADLFHLDIMDGVFVPNLSYGFPIVEAIAKSARKPLDVHLMIDAPERYIKDFADAGADIITFHAEATPHSHRVIQQIKELGKKAGIALNPSTPLSVLDYVMDDADMILIMSVNPGFGGQSYIPATTEKIRALKEKLGKRAVDIEVDGGITVNNISEVLSAGANVIVAGSAVFGQKNISESTKQLLNLL